MSSIARSLSISAKSRVVVSTIDTPINGLSMSIAVGTLPRLCRFVATTYLGIAALRLRSVINSLEHFFDPRLFRSTADPTWAVLAGGALIQAGRRCSFLDAIVPND